MLRLQGAQLPRELLERRVGLLSLQVARLLQGREGVVYAGYGDLVWADVEVLDRVVDELVLGGLFVSVPEGVLFWALRLAALVLQLLDPLREAS